MDRYSTGEVLFSCLREKNKTEAENDTPLFGLNTNIPRVTSLSPHVVAPVLGSIEKGRKASNRVYARMIAHGFSHQQLQF
jgi:hypothetical protein